MTVAVVFDLDDTLYLEADFVRSGFQCVGDWCRRELGIDGFEHAAWQFFLDGRRGDIFDATLALLGLAPSPQTISRMVGIYRGHAPHIVLPADSAECIRQLHGNYKLGLITDGPSLTQWNKIRALHLEEYFKEIIVTSELGPGFGKPHPHAFMAMEERLQTSGSEVFYVADNPAKDFIVPSRMGWRTIRILRGDGLHRAVADLVATEFSLPDLTDIPTLVSRS